MSSAETTHAVEWRDDGNGGETAHQEGRFIGEVWPSGVYPGKWTAWNGKSRIAFEDLGAFPTASAARAFVERTVREAGR